MAITFGVLGGYGIYVAAAVAVAAAAAGAYAAYESSEAQQRAIQYQKRQADIQAKQARDAAAAAADLAHDRHQRILAAQRAALGAAGVTTTEGSPLILQMESAEQAALEEGRIRAAGATTATGFESQAKLFNYQRGQVQRAGYYGVGTSILGGVTNVYKAYNSGTTTYA